MEPSQELKSLLSQNLELTTSLLSTLSSVPSEEEAPHVSDLREILDLFHLHLSSLEFPFFVNVVILTGYLSLTLKLLGQLEESCGSFPLTARALEHLIVSSSKLNAMVSSWDQAATGIPLDDLLSQPRDHERWRRLNDYTEIITPTNPGALRKVIEEMYKSVIWAHAFISKGLCFSNKYLQKIMTGFFVFYYNFSPMKAYHQARLNFAHPSMESILTLARTEDSLLVKMFESSPFKIQTNEMIYVSRGTDGLSMKPGEQTIPVRVVSTYRLPQLKLNDRGLFRVCSTALEVTGYRPNRVIMHVHGGGFIAMSSASHLPYLQKWAIDTNSVIFSVDYRLAPEHPYPAGLDDVWQVYTWLISQAKSQLDIDPQHIVLAGDSAGGHLVLGCMIRALQNGFRLPDGLVLPYPALSMDSDCYTPSLTLSLDDMCLNYTFLRFCVSAYIQDPSLDTKNDPLLSPLSAPLELLAMFPPTRLLIGTLDPLMDDCLRFAERLLDARVDMRLSIFEGHVHGGMNYMMRTENEEARALALKASAYLNELLGDRL